FSVTSPSGGVVRSGVFVLKTETSKGRRQLRPSIPVCVLRLSYNRCQRRGMRPSSAKSRSLSAIWILAPLGPCTGLPNEPSGHLQEQDSFSPVLRNLLST